MSAGLSGELRRLPLHGSKRVLQALTLWLFFQAAGRLVMRALLRYREHFELQREDQRIHLMVTRKIFGRTWSTSQDALPLSQLQELTLREQGEDASFAAGLIALGLGTFLGVQLLAEGLLANGASAWLLSGGAVLLALGVAVDFFLGSGRSPREPRGRAELTLRVSGRGWVLSVPNRQDAQAWFDSLSGLLERPQEPAESSRESGPAHSPAE